MQIKTIDVKKIPKQSLRLINFFPILTDGKRHHVAIEIVNGIEKHYVDGVYTGAVSVSSVAINS